MLRSIIKIAGPILLLTLLITFGLPVDAAGAKTAQDDLNLSAEPTFAAATVDRAGDDGDDDDDDDDWRDWDRDDKDDDDNDDRDKDDDDWDDWDRGDRGDRADRDDDDSSIYDDDDDDWDDDWRYDDDDDEDWGDSWRGSWRGRWNFSWNNDDDWDYGSNNFPHRRKGRVEFRYHDDGYDHVYICGDFTDWHRRPMRLDRAEGDWVIRLPLDYGRYFYRFEAEEDGDSWRVIDPSNSSQKKLGGRGWVSILDLEESGRVRNGHYSSRRHVRNEFEREASFLRIDDEEVIGAVGYQRVDGLILGIAPEYISTYGFEPSAKGHLSYGFRSKKWSGSLTVLQPLATRNRVWLKLNGFAGTDYNNQTGIASMENTLAAACFRLDFRDYFQREGGSASIVFAGLPWLRIEGGVHANDYSSLENHARWSLTSGEFKPNPAIDEGTMRSVFGAVRIGKRYNYLDLQYEASGDEIMGGDYHFEQAVATCRSRVRLGRDQHVDFRLVGGANFDGYLPVQKRFVMGGLGTVRGYKYQSLLIPSESAPITDVYGGELMALGNVEYTFKLDSDLDLILLYDIGMVWEDRDAEIDAEEFMDSIGVGFLLDDGDLRVNVVKPLDEKDSDPIVQVRMTRTF
ncbi:MAG: BamA/TamA family outer membrane protein [bacterium]|nr:BamA/TamA family outer membrane protein [bacterium]